MSASKLLQRRYGRYAGISMIELLLVLFLIAIIISLLLPTFSSTRFTTKELSCQNNMREVGRGFMDFAQANKQKLPGNSSTIRPQDNPQAASWLFCSVNQSVPFNPSSPTLLNPVYDQCPQSGTLFEFTRHKKLYRCPALEVAPLGTGLGSNGMFDYGMLNALYGARLDRLPINAYFHYPTSANTQASMSVNEYDVRLLPIIVEENPAVNINKGNIEADFSNWDEMANTHRRNGIAQAGAAANYVASDCSVQFFFREQRAQQGRHIWAAHPMYGTANYLGFLGPVPVGQWDNVGFAKFKPSAWGGVSNGTRVPRSELPAAFAFMGAP